MVWFLSLILENAQLLSQERMKERNMEGGRKERRQEGKRGKERQSTCLCNISRRLEPGYRQSLDNVKMTPWNSVGESGTLPGSPLEYHTREERHKCAGRVQKSKVTSRDLESMLS